ncbi:S8 family serine peptidase [Mucilaginibacter sp. UR6-11]|uniref:S8 family serine peptidase n=1 Tax=Mucilaginibacter sp. UR6-11 TaxID=1435644 RepID=UPI001E5D50C6|nr:S8 family serine peptidase [Mucilaginibacter sp. UR6-11]MCC8425954.1 S8 family serine peptidase [Mucilaginibacter sp. UR6-11]
MFFQAAGALAQQPESPSVNWQLMDLKADGVFGISMEKAYAEILKGKKAKTVIVAVLDGGVDVRHEDLKQVIWTNAGEIPGNGKDDDHNGFADDLHGWNFYSPMTKGDPEFDIAELTKSIRASQAEGKDVSQLRKALDEKLLPLKQKLETATAEKKALENMTGRIGRPVPTQSDFRNFIPRNETELSLQKNMVYGLKVYPDYVNYKRHLIDRSVTQYQMEMDFYLDQDYDLKTGGPTTYHGTHIAGIIAAVRNNKIGMNGVADKARLMVVRTIGGIDLTDSPGEFTRPKIAGEEEEADLRVASAIRYAVNNGARVINISFGQRKSMLAGKRLEAINYALSKDVLIVHASGNQGQDEDLLNNADNAVPSPANWIEVGASGFKNDGSLAAAFSNYGKTTVDVFAPGVAIYSTAPRSAYAVDSGTSMAAPVVSGLAAVLREYYPDLSAEQVKNIIIASVTKSEFLKDKCLSGGVVNACQALKLAAGTMKRN